MSINSELKCINDLSTRHKPKVEEKAPKLSGDIKEIMEPHRQSEPHLRNTLLHADIIAQTVYEALIAKGWTKDDLPTPLTISNILNQHNYRLWRMEKTRVQKNEDMDAIF